MWALAAAAPFAGGAALWDWVRRHPVLFAAALLAYEVALVAANVLGQALGEAQKSWTASLGRAIDAAARRLVSRYGRRYRRFLTLIHHDVDLKGLATRGEYSLALTDVFVDVGLVPRPAHDAPASVVAAQPPQPKQGPLRRPVWEFLREAAAGHALVIIGPPGGGKTTLLKHITLVLAAGGQPARARGAPRHKVPILLYLREHAAAIAADPAVTLPSIAAAAMGRSGLAEPPGW